MVFIQTSFYFIIGFIIAFACGYGIVRLLLPEKYREYEFVIMPPVGYAVMCWLLFTLSGTFNLRVPAVCWPALIVLLLLSVLTYWFRQPRHTLREIFVGVGCIGILSSTILLVILWPMFYIGADTHLGAVNPDYFASFLDNYYLMNHATASLSYQPDSSSPFKSGADSICAS